MERLIDNGLLIKNPVNILESPISIYGLGKLLEEFGKAHNDIKVEFIKEDDIKLNKVNNLVNEIINVIDSIECDSYITDTYIDLDLDNIDNNIINEFRDQLMNTKNHENIINLLFNISNFIYINKDKNEFELQELKKGQIEQYLQILLILKSILKDSIFTNDLMCINILNTKKEENKLNFFVWCGLPNINDGTRHSSLVLNYNDNYYFIDPCYNDFKRNPSNFLFEKEYFKYGQVFIMESTLQKDGFNCTSFCYEMIINLTEKFEKFDKNINKFDEYLKVFFNSDVKNTNLISEKSNNEVYFVKDEKSNTLSLLPFEILKLCQSYTFLKELRKKVESNNVNIDNIELLEEIKEEFKFLDELDENMTYIDKIKSQEINIKREEHLKILEKICNNLTDKDISPDLIKQMN